MSEYQDSTKQARVIDKEERKALWYEMSDKPIYEALSRLSYYLVARADDVRHLKRSYITKAGYIRVYQPKTKTFKRMALHEGITSAIDLVPVGKTDYIFEGQGKDGLISLKPYNRVLKDRAELIGLDGVSGHSLRRSACTELYHEFVRLNYETNDPSKYIDPYRAVAKYSGHKNLDNLIRYINIDAARVDDLSKAYMLSTMN